MISSLWIYEINHWISFFTAFVLLFSATFIAYQLGLRVKNREPENNAFYLADFIPSTILGMLALILGFTFSLTISRFENRRQLVISEANAIGTARLRADLLRPPNGEIIDGLLREYLDARIDYYAESSELLDRKDLDDRVSEIEDKIWEITKKMTQTDRGALENSFVSALNTMTDLRNERNIALNKSLPPMIYLAILLISGSGLMALNFARAERREVGQWQPAILIFLISFVFYLILDIDRPKSGAIQITQDAMIALRASWHK